MKKSSVISAELFLRLKCQSDEFMTICSKLLFTDNNYSKFAEKLLSAQAPKVPIQIVEEFIELTFLMMP